MITPPDKRRRLSKLIALPTPSGNTPSESREERWTHLSVRLDRRVVQALRTFAADVGTEEQAPHVAEYLIKLGIEKFVEGHLQFAGATSRDNPSVVLFIPAIKAPTSSPSQNKDGGAA